MEMDSNYQRWYENLMKNRDQTSDLIEGNTTAIQQEDLDTDNRSPFTCLDFDLLASTSVMPDLPPSLAAANESYQTMPSYETVAYGNFEGASAEADYTFDQVAAMSPHSFHQRTLQMAMPLRWQDFDVWSDEVFAHGPSSNRVDSATGSLNDSHEIARSANQGDFASPSKGVEQHEASGSLSSPLQYHLIQMKSRAELKENVAPPQLHDSMEDNLQPNASNDHRTLSCHLCPDRQYTGTWAHRNLTRHMETMHAPCSSPDGKQIRCSHQNCGKTFRRDDARLVHERRSHPDLNRPPAMKRKRSDDL